MTILSIILESFSSLFKSIESFLRAPDLTMGAILAALTPFFVIWNRIAKEKEKRLRSLRIEQRQLHIESNIVNIMAKLGVEDTWIIPEIGSSSMDRMSLKRLSNYLTKRKGRVRQMERLKSRKLWITVISALLLILKEGFDIPVDSETVLAFAGIVITAILGLAHVDGKREQNAKITPTDDGPAV